VTKPVQTPSPAATPWPPSTPLLSEDKGHLSTTASHGGIALNIQRELAQDIEKAGGIKLLKANKQSLQEKKSMEDKAT
jgi:hypothetical protein